MHSKQHRTEQMWLKMEPLTQQRGELLKLCECGEKRPRSKQLDESQWIKGTKMFQHENCCHL